MIPVVPDLQDAVINYAAHCLRAKVKFLVIKSIINAVKNDPPIVLIVADRKQKVLPIRYRDSHVGYFGKRGMSLLGAMEVRSKSVENESVFEYTFVDYVVKNHTSQDHVKKAAGMQLAVGSIAERHPGAKSVVLQTDNATAFFPSRACSLCVQHE